MTREKFLSSIWVRLAVFAWIVVFPLVFIALPAMEMFTGEQEQSWTPVWALIVWMLGPWAASIVMKWIGPQTAHGNEQKEEIDA